MTGRSNGVFANLRDSYFRYYETPFSLGLDVLNAERRAILDRPGGVWQPPLVEVRPRYVSAEGDLSRTLQRAGAHRDLAGILGLGMFDGIPNLYLHQAEALAAATKGRDLAAVAGTGSGKTESLFMPVIDLLLHESERWPANSLKENRWWAKGGGFSQQRVGEDPARQAAVRAFVVYPMNALADDQLVRLRKTLDSDPVHNWLDNNRKGNRFYFGRYTGNTPVLGGETNPDAVAELQNYLKGTEGQYQAAVDHDRQNGGGSRFYMPRPDGAELRSRWDMRAAPPDILVTNFTMLNIMLMRKRDSVFFASTRDWLESNDANRVSLIIDEVHTYRGTAGTEIAYVLRLLADRLGIANVPERMQILAGSASLEPDRDAKFLRDFFARGKDFSFVGGALQPVPPAGRDLKSHVNEFLQPVDDSGEASALLTRADVEQVLLSALHQGDPVGSAVPLTALEARLFPGRDDADMLTQNLIRALEVRGPDNRPQAVRLRFHQFFRNVSGLWACTNRECGSVAEEYVHERRSVGKLYSQPVARCDCGSRVLELLYCEDCGEVYLGGFASANPVTNTSGSLSLLADLSDIASLPDQAITSRSAANYVVVWPGENPPVDVEWRVGSLDFSYAPVELLHGMGDVARRLPGEAGNAWQFVTRPGAIDPATLPAFPTRCAACGVDREVTHGRGGKALKAESPDRLRSPIRTLRTGFEKINQVLVGELANSLEQDQRRLIVFSDSRQDAAKLSAGIGIRHYQDLVRSLFVEQLENSGPISGETVELVRRYVVDGERNDETRTARATLMKRDLQAYNALRNALEDEPPDPDRVAEAAQPFSDPLQLPAVQSRIVDDLLGMGINPGGPYPSISRTHEKNPRPWTSLYENWDNQPLIRGNLDLAERALEAAIRGKSTTEFYNALAGSAGRDIESLGIGWFALKGDEEPAAIAGDVGIARASLRLLILRRRIESLREGTNSPPRFLRKFWTRVAGAGNWEDIRDDCIRIWGPAVVQYVVKPERLVVRTSDKQWLCDRCARRHLVAGARICTRCSGNLASPDRLDNLTDDYYAWKASTGHGRFRLHTAELTGQTDRVDAQSRQLRFQDVFIAGEKAKKADGLDLLSVTTTMEAGVDIGGLEAVVLANMPPTRFNYQQRVGRAGRRFSPVAISLTVCRGRSHDENYFRQPELIANEKTPPPYLALNRLEIFYRILKSEVLRRAFISAGSQEDWKDSLNPHGDFGNASDWDKHRDAVVGWLSGNHAEIRRLSGVLRNGTPLPAIGEAAFVDGLIRELDSAAAGLRGSADLSERLAHDGKLPMFGFPSRVRLLYLGRRPGKSYPWPPHGTVDRDLALAVSTFAPGASVVRDGQVFTAIAVVGYSPASPGRPPKADPNPLGDPRLLDMCRVCGSAEDKAANDPQLLACPRCGSDENYGRIDMREPAGFASTMGEDFDGSFAWTGSSGAVRAIADLENLREVIEQGVIARSGPGERLVVNDRRGEMYKFRQAKPTAKFGSGFYASEALDLFAVKAADLHDEETEVALGACQQTDLLFVGAPHGSIPELGLRLNFEQHRQPSGVVETWQGRRAAWYSLAALIRRTAATFLDVQPNEFVSGIHISSHNGKTASWAFLADVLENGAGFSTHLGSTEEFPNFLSAINVYIESLRKPDHADSCSGSCYVCLRDYSNMAFHSLLDWRLAADLITALSGRAPKLDTEVTRRILAGWAQAYGAQLLGRGEYGQVCVPRGGETVVLIPRHPLEAYEVGTGGVVADRLAREAALAAAESGVSAVVMADTFTMETSPRDVLALIDAAIEESAESW